MPVYLENATESVCASIAHKVLEWVAKVVTVPGELIVNIDFVELTPGTLELQVNCVSPV